MAREDVKVKSGVEFDHYFPRAKLITITKKKGATVADTLLLIPAIVNETSFHTKRFAKEVIQHKTLLKTCENIWQFVYDHIAYKKDEDGKEQVRSPARTWHDRHNKDTRGNTMGVDCDCYTVFISSILTNLNIKHALRITKYGANHFQHIYPIVPIGQGKYITIDCVVHSFNYEEPYTEKKDTTMDLEYLNGVSDPSNSSQEELLSAINDKEAMYELGKLFKKKASSSNSSSEGGGKKKGRLKEVLKKGIHAANRVNPAAASIRLGVLAAMKLNFMKIGSELKYTYLTDEEAQRRGMPVERFTKMKRVREKLEKIFYGAGGKPEDLKKAILKGKGNKNNEVPMNGLDYVSNSYLDGLHEDLSTSHLLGNDMMLSEGIGEINGMGELGEPATAATIAAASTILTTIVAMIKKVGSLAPKKKNDAGGSENSSTSNEGSGGEESARSEDPNRNTTSTDTAQSSETSSSRYSANSEQNSSSSNLPTTTNNDKMPVTTSDKEDDDSSNQRSAEKGTPPATTNKLKLFWDSNKKWIKPTGIGVASVGLLALVYKFFKPTKRAVNGLNGLPKTKATKKVKRKVKHKKKVKHKTNFHSAKHKTPVELL